MLEKNSGLADYANGSVIVNLDEYHEKRDAKYEVCRQAAAKFPAFNIVDGSEFDRAKVHRTCASRFPGVAAVGR